VVRSGNCGIFGVSAYLKTVLGGVIAHGERARTMRER